MINQDLRQQLSQDMALVLLQPKGEPEFNMKDLQATWNAIMTPEAALAAQPAVDDLHQDASDIPRTQ